MFTKTIGLSLAAFWILTAGTSALAASPRWLNCEMRYLDHFYKNDRVTHDDRGRVNTPGPTVRWIKYGTTELDLNRTLDGGATDLLLKYTVKFNPQNSTMKVSWTNGTGGRELQYLQYENSPAGDIPLKQGKWQKVSFRLNATISHSKTWSPSTWGSYSYISFAELNCFLR